MRQAENRKKQIEEKNIRQRKQIKISSVMSSLYVRGLWQK